MDGVAAIGWEILDRIRVGDFTGPSPHGIGIAFGYLAGSWWMLREGRKRGLSEDDMSTALLRALVGAILGARFFYVLAHFSEFESPVDMLKIWEGGISLIGGIFGAIIVAYPTMRSRRMGFLRTMDAASIGLAFGILFGRVGDLIIGDHLGKPASWALAFVYKGGPLSGYDCTTVAEVCRQLLSNGQSQVVTPQGAELYSPTGELLQSGTGVHQTALYDFISTFFLFALLVWLARRRRHEGVLIATFGLWYGAMRIATDFLRIDKRFFGLTGSQWASVAVVTIASVALVKWSLRGRVAEPETVGAGDGAGAAAAIAGAPRMPAVDEQASAREPDQGEPPGVPEASEAGGESVPRSSSVTSFEPPRDPTTRR